VDSVYKWYIPMVPLPPSSSTNRPQPLVAVQNHLPPALNSVGMSAIIFGQNFGAALFLSFAQTTLSAGLLDALPKFAPEVNFQTVINAGATGFRAVVPKDQVGGVILAYNQSVNHVFYLATGAAVGAFVFSWGTGGRVLRRRRRLSRKLEAVWLEDLRIPSSSDE